MRSVPAIGFDADNIRADLFGRYCADDARKVSRMDQPKSTSREQPRGDDGIDPSLALASLGEAVPVLRCPDNANVERDF